MAKKCPLCCKQIKSGENRIMVMQGDKVATVHRTCNDSQKYRK